MKKLVGFNTHATTTRSSKTLLSVLLITLVFSTILSFSLSSLVRSPPQISSLGKTSNEIQALSTTAPYSLDWTKTWGLTGVNEYTTGLAVDSKNDIYVVSLYYPALGQNRSAFLAKYDTAGTQLWNQTWGGSHSELTKGVAVDHNDNVIVIGHTTSFGSITSFDIFTVKYNSAGVQQWNATWGGHQDEWAQGVTVDSNNNIYVVGVTKSFSVGNWDICLVKYNSAGTKQWNVTWGTTEEDFGTDVAVDTINNNIYVTGHSETGSIPDMVLLKYEPNIGTLLWNISWGDTGYDMGNSIEIDSNNHIYVCGDTYSYIEGNGHLFLTKFYPNNTLIWSRVWGYPECVTVGHDIAIDSDDNVYVTGETTCPSSNANYDAFVIQYDSAGNQPWHMIWAQADVDQKGFEVALDSSKNLYVAGLTEHTDPTHYDAYLVKYTFSDSGGIPGFQVPLIIATFIMVISWLIIPQKSKYTKK